LYRLLSAFKLSFTLHAYLSSLNDLAFSSLVRFTAVQYTGYSHNCLTGFLRGKASTKLYVGWSAICMCSEYFVS